MILNQNNVTKKAHKVYSATDCEIKRLAKRLVDGNIDLNCFKERVSWLMHINHKQKSLLKKTREQFIRDKLRPFIMSVATSSPDEIEAMQVASDLNVNLVHDGYEEDIEYKGTPVRSAKHNVSENTERNKRMIESWTNKKFNSPKEAMDFAWVMDAQRRKMQHLTKSEQCPLTQGYEETKGLYNIIDEEYQQILATTQ